MKSFALFLLSVVAPQAYASNSGRDSHEMRHESLQLESTLPRSSADGPTLETAVIAEPADVVPTASAEPMPFSDDDRQRLSPEGTRAFFKMMRLWKIDDEQAAALLGLSQERLSQMRADSEPALDAGTLLRISYLLGVFQRLNTIYHPGEQANSWLRTTQAGDRFDGKTPLAFVGDGGLPALKQLHRYLDGWNCNTIFLRKMELWKVSDEDARRLLDISAEKFAEIKARPNTALEGESFKRMNHFIAAIENFDILFSGGLDTDRWMQSPNTGPVFQGKTPLDHMLQGGLPAIEEVRRYAEALRWGN